MVVTILLHANGKEMGLNFFDISDTGSKVSLDVDNNVMV
jgi:hypothetical protein